jgi:hypothetical protein
MVLDKLRQLQDADLQLRTLELKKATHDRTVKVRAVQIDKAKADIDALRARHKVARAQADAKELEVRQKRADIEKLRGQQMQVKNNDQYQALQNEIKFIELAIAKVEDDILTDYGDVEAIGGKVRAAQEELARQEKGLADLRAEIETKKDAVDAEIEAHRRLRDSIASELPRKVVDQFTRIADRLDGEALAPVSRDEDEGGFVCGGCHMSVTQNTYVLLAGHGDSIIMCPNCTRILYLDDA